MTTRPLINDRQIAYFQQMRENGMVREVEEIYRIFVRESCLTMSDLAGAVMLRDYPSVAQLCHRLKGSFSAFGADQLSAGCRLLENEAVARRADKLTPLFMELNRDLRITLKEIGERLHVSDH